METTVPVPRTFAILLAAVVATLLLQVLLFSSDLLPGLLWPALVAALSLSALLGSSRAACALKYLLYFMAAAGLLVLIAGPISLVFVARTILVATLLAATARYIGRSAAVARFYASLSSISGASQVSRAK